MERLPLHILVGPAEEAVLYEGQLVAGLKRFELYTREDVVQTTFECTNCFPRPSGHRLQQDAREEFPLRLYVGDRRDEILVSYDGTAIGHVREIYTALSTQSKRVMRITFAKPLPDDLHTALLDLGVEVVVQSPDADSALGDVDAHL